MYKAYLPELPEGDRPQARGEILAGYNSEVNVPNIQSCERQAAIVQNQSIT